MARIADKLPQRRPAQEMRVQPKVEPKSVSSRPSVYERAANSIFQFCGVIEEILMNSSVDIATIRPQSINDIFRMSQSLAAMAKTGIDLERWEYEKQRRIEDTANEILSEVRVQLANDPETYQKFYDIVQSSTEVVKSRRTARPYDQRYIESDT